MPQSLYCSKLLLMDADGLFIRFENQVWATARQGLPPMGCERSGRVRDGIYLNPGSIFSTFDQRVYHFHVGDGVVKRSRYFRIMEYCF